MANTNSGKAKTTIELNGKLYDARTGKILGDTQATPVNHAQPSTANVADKRSSGTVVDGFVRRPHVARSMPTATPAANTTPHPTSRSKPNTKKPALQKSQTLMRPTVRKPAKLVDSTPVPAQKVVAKKANPARVARAASTPQSNSIQKYHGVQPMSGIIKKQAVVPVAAPQQAVATPATVAGAPVQPADVTNHIAQLATSTEAHLKESVDVIEESLRNASAHLQHFDDTVNRRGFFRRFGFFKSRAANLAMLSIAGFLLLGFFAYQNAPNLEMQMASARSGVAAQLPGYKPAGFRVGKGIKAEPGKVTVAFRSNSSDKEYTVTQQSSNWSSDALLANHVLASKKPYQTYQSEGRTVFIYDDSNATWVNGGIWYEVNGNSSLSSDQLLRIANSF